MFVACFQVKQLFSRLAVQSYISRTCRSGFIELHSNLASSETYDPHLMPLKVNDLCLALRDSTSGVELSLKGALPEVKTAVREAGPRADRWRGGKSPRSVDS